MDKEKEKLIKFVIRNVLSIEEKGKNTHVTIKKGFIRSNELEYIKRKLDYKDIMISAKDKLFFLFVHFCIYLLHSTK
jgi:predicted nucleic-acid-binding protein